MEPRRNLSQLYTKKCFSHNLPCQLNVPGVAGYENVSISVLELTFSLNGPKQKLDKSFGNNVKFEN